jgi:hypothetical protein
MLMGTEELAKEWLSRIEKLTRTIRWGLWRRKDNAMSDVSSNSSYDDDGTGSYPTGPLPHCICPVDYIGLFGLTAPSWITCSNGLHRGESVKEYLINESSGLKG